MKILNYEKFLEANLNLGELDKMLNGIKRGDVLVNKLVSGDTIITSDDKKIKIDKMIDGDDWVPVPSAINNMTTDGKYDVEKSKKYLTKGNRYQNTFMDEKGDEFKLSQFKKTNDFGSRGAGKDIKKFESIQCIFLAIKQLYPQVTLTNDNISSFYNRFMEIDRNVINELLHIPSNIIINDELVIDYLSDKEWVYTFTEIPNKLWVSVNKYIDRSKKYHIFHISYDGTDFKSPFKILNEKYRELAKNENFKDINIAKYCPADVFLLEYGMEQVLEETIKGVTASITDLNNKLNTLFDSKTFIPISLKKISDSSFSIITNNEVDKEMPIFKIDKFMIGSDMKGIASKISTTSIWKHRDDKDVDLSNRIINFDTSDSSNRQDIDGEVSGSSSRHGKIKFSYIKKILNSSGYESELMSSSDLRKFSIEELEYMVIEYIDYIKDNNINGMLICLPIRGRSIIGNENKLISRIQSLQVILYLLKIYNIEKDAADLCITKLMRYALSIQTDMFDTPRYLRVI